MKKKEVDKFEFVDSGGKEQQLQYSQNKETFTDDEIMDDEERIHKKMQILGRNKKCKE